MTEQNPDMDFAAPALSEIEVGAIWSLQGNRGHRLPELVRGLFGDFARMNEMLVREPLRLLQLSPHEALLLTGAADLPANIENFTATARSASTAGWRCTSPTTIPRPTWRRCASGPAACAACSAGFRSYSGARIPPA